MRILVDADGCPVRNIIVKVAKEKDIPVIFIVDTCHIINDDYAEVKTVDKSKDGVDIALINLVEQGDLVVTQDYGVATMAIGKGVKAVNQNGLIFSDNNIDRLLFERHLGQKIRRAGGRTSTSKKRTQKDNDKFEHVLRTLIEGNNPDNENGN